MLGGPSAGAAAESTVRVPAPPETPVEGGGAITLEPRDTPAPLRMPCRVPLLEVAPTEGGGAITLEARDAFEALRSLREVPLLTDGGGGTTLAASELPLPLPAVFAFTDGGGGTTSVAPKILPIKLLMNDPLPDGDGGGGTTDLDGSGTLPLAR